MYNLSICGIKTVSRVGALLVFLVTLDLFYFAVRRNGECIVFLDVSFAFEERVYFL